MKQIALGIAIALITTTAFGQHAHQQPANGETGQAQFAAIAEIVAQLRKDTKTNWAKVDIDALRDHLVDMDNVTTKSSVETTIDGQTVTFDISGPPPVAASIQRMVLAHSPMLHQETGWNVQSEKTANGAVMHLRLSSMNAVNEVRGLGFFGVMTIGAHHQQHHLMIAKGHSPH